MSSPIERMEELRERVEEQEAELRFAVEDLEVAARRAIDARRWIRSRPFLWTSAAFLVGVWLGARRR